MLVFWIYFSLFFIFWFIFIHFQILKNKKQKNIASNLKLAYLHSRTGHHFLVIEGPGKGETGGEEEDESKGAVLSYSSNTKKAAERIANALGYPLTDPKVSFISFHSIPFFFEIIFFSFLFFFPSFFLFLFLFLFSFLSQMNHQKLWLKSVL